MASIKLTEIEERLLLLIPVHPKVISSSVLITEFYGNKIPFNGRAIIVNRVTGIMKKLSAMNSRWKIEKSDRAGPNPINYSKMKRL